METEKQAQEIGNCGKCTGQEKAYVNNRAAFIS
jgi:hypothetical protein